MFGCFRSPKELGQARTNREIQKMLKKERKRKSKEAEMLLLGTGESGKSTLMKQVKIIYRNGYSKDELVNYKGLVCSNIFTAMQSLLTGMSALELSFQEEECKGLSEMVSAKDAAAVRSISQEEYRAVKTLWKDGGIQLAYERRREFYLPDSAKYFLDDLDRICSKDYTPNEHDVLRVKEPTTGINEYSFTVQNTTYTTIRMIDIGVQKSERRKWIHSFEGVRCVMFVVALSDYDQTLCLEESGGETVNRLMESKALFQTILEYPWFQRSFIILLFNKVDLFREKIETSHLKDYFPEYEGPQCNVDSAAKFIVRMFLNVVPQAQRSRPISHHFITATDISNIQVVFLLLTTPVFYELPMNCNLL